MNKRPRKKRSQITYKGIMEMWRRLMGTVPSSKPLRWVGCFESGLVCECGARVPFGTVHSHDGNSGQMPVNAEMTEFLRGMGTSGHSQVSGCL